MSIFILSSCTFLTRTYTSYRTPLCILYSPRVIAVACYVLGQRVIDGPNSPSLDARISASAPSNSLPTPPSHKPPSPDATRAAIDYYNLTDAELTQISGISFRLETSAFIFKEILLCRSDWYTVRILLRSRPRNLPISRIHHFGKIHTFFQVSFLALRHKGPPTSPADSEGAIVRYSVPSGSADEFK